MAAGSSNFNSVHSGATEPAMEVIVPLPSIGRECSAYGRRAAVDQYLLVRLGIGQFEQAEMGQLFFQRIADANGDEIVSPGRQPQGTIKAGVEEVAE